MARKATEEEVRALRANIKGARHAAIKTSTLLHTVGWAMNATPPIPGSGELASNAISALNAARDACENVLRSTTVYLETLAQWLIEKKAAEQEEKAE